MFQFCKKAYKAQYSQKENDTAESYSLLNIIEITIDKKTVRVKANYLQYELEVGEAPFHPNPIPFEHDKVKEDLNEEVKVYDHGDRDPVANHFSIWSDVLLDLY